MSIKMHKISFTDTENGWYNALPIGNGKMGAMVFFDGEKLHIAMNQYDCYYQILSEYAKDHTNTDLGTFKDPAKEEKNYRDICAIVDNARKNTDYQKMHYTNLLHGKITSAGVNKSNADKIRPKNKSTAYPDAGEVILSFSWEVDLSATSLELHIEEAKIWFEAGRGEDKVVLCLWVPEGLDTVIIEDRSERDTLAYEVWLRHSLDRGQERYDYKWLSEGRVIHCAFHPDGESDKWPAFLQESAYDTYTTKEGQRYILCTVKAGEGSGLEEIRLACQSIEALQEKHTKEWTLFFKSSITIPDKYLETLWHLAVYLLKCSDGAGSTHYEQACGLSGFTDIKKPCLWGSMWYWDVNIQSAFSCAGASNHIEQLRHFCDAYLSYEDKIEAYTKKIYGISGWALDYQHTLYNCIQPWCAHYLWDYYRYTEDKDFLMKKAYPVFWKQLVFYEHISVLGTDGVRHIQYDISPEQGSVVSDSTITTAAIKALLGAAKRAAALLERPEYEKRIIDMLIKQLPTYAKDTKGIRWKDSKETPDELYLRHPSLLMPIYPMQEITSASKKHERKLAVETIAYASKNTERGTFGFPWIASAYAVMGLGDEAIRILYEEGIDYVTHSNGLGYEESERFINYCHISKNANYLPAMMETTGGIAETLNLMLLRTDKGVVYLFPALPLGKDSRTAVQSQYVDDAEKAKKYQAWNQVEINNMLAYGGFLISAKLKGDTVTFLEIRSLLGGHISLSYPESGGQKKQSFTMKKGEIRCLRSTADACSSQSNKEEMLVRDEAQTHEEVLIHEAVQTHRRIFLGEDKNTAFYKAVDAFVCPYSLGDSLQYPMTVYVFDFTKAKSDDEKDYDTVYSKQAIVSNHTFVYPGGPIQIGTEKYSFDKGYGFISGQVRKAIDRGQPDALRRDFIEGRRRAVFGVELPRGKYDILVISGDEEEGSLTTIEIKSAGIKKTGRGIRAGRYQCTVIPLMHECDGILSIALSTEQGGKWKCNAIFINKLYADL